jgi:hypothetical protein
LVEEKIDAFVVEFTIRGEAFVGITTADFSGFETGGVAHMLHALLFSGM